MGHQDLDVWNKSKTLATRIFKVADRAVNDVLAMQLERAALSVPFAIAESAASRNKIQRLFHLKMALSWSGTLKYFLTEANSCDLITQSVYQHMAADIEEIEHLLWAHVEVLRAAETVATSASAA